MRQQAPAGLRSAPTRHEPRKPQRPPPEGPRPPAPQDVEVGHGRHAEQAAQSEWPAWAAPDAGDGRSPDPTASAPAQLTRRRLVPSPLTASHLVPESPRRLPPLAGSPADDIPMLALGPSLPAAATRPRATLTRATLAPGRERTAYRERRQDGRLAEVRSDGAAYGHTRSAHGEGGHARGQAVDDGPTRPTDVDTRIRQVSERCPKLGCPAIRMSSDCQDRRTAKVSVAANASTGRAIRV